MATKAYQGPVEINGVTYHVRGPVLRQTILEWADVQPITAEQTRRTRRLVQSHEMLGVKGLLVDRDYDAPSGPQWVYDSTLETRWPPLVCLSGLWGAEAPFTYDTGLGSVGQSHKLYGVVGGVPFDSKVFLLTARTYGAGINPPKLDALLYNTTTEDWDTYEIVDQTALANAATTSAYTYEPWDLKQHGSYLFAVATEYNGYAAAPVYAVVVRRRSVGSTTWATPTGTNLGTVTAHNNAFLLCSLAGRLHILRWTATNGNLDTNYSTDDGTTWQASYTAIGKSAYPPSAFIPFTDENGNLVPHIGLAEGVIRVDTSGATPEMVIDLREQVSQFNCRGMKPWAADGNLYVPLEKAPLGQLIQYRAENGIRVVRRVGLDRGVGLPAARKGHISGLVDGGQWLLALVRNSTTAECGIFAWDGQGWHHIYNSNTSSGDWPTTGTPEPLLICTSHLGDNIERLHLVFYDSANARGDSLSVKYPLEYPPSQSSFAYESTGYLDTTRYAGGLPEHPKTWLQVYADADDLSASTAGEYITLQFGKDGQARTANSPAANDFLSTTKTLTYLDTNAGANSNTIAEKLTFTRDAGATGDSPKLYAFVRMFFAVPTARHLWRLLVDIQESAIPGFLTEEDVITNLETVEDAVAQVTFSVAPESQVYVKALSPSPSFSLTLSGEPDPYESLDRKGTVELLLAELI